ncbi:MAG: TonB-dependent receptor plug domain-containing protein [Lacipirellulaceae bacterium]|uniref:TonB-dependent receptor plug domain-containing protein n=1 Tax=Marinobacter salarius TaxID=1420917 RepID=UPI0032ECC216
MAGSAGAAHSQGGPQLEEVVVTAQKRAENVQDVPISIQSFSGETMQDMGIVQIDDLSIAVPAVVFKELGGALFISMRGLGSQTSNNGSYNNVAVYMDGAYLPRGQMAVMDTSSIENIEILKVPQGALYGRNATAGAIIVTTKTPMGGDELSGSINATAGTDNQQVYSGQIYGGITDTIGAGFTFFSDEQDGWVKNLYPEFGPDLGRQRSKSYSGILSFTPNDRVTSSLSVRYTEYISDRGQNFQSTFPEGATAFLGGTLSAILQGGGAPPSVADPLGAQIASQAIFDFPYSQTSDNFINAYSPLSLTTQRKAKTNSWAGNFTSFEDTLAIFNFKVDFDDFELVSTTSYEDYYADQTAGVLPYIWADDGATFDAVFMGALNANGQIGFNGQ